MLRWEKNIVLLTITTKLLLFSQNFCSLILGIFAFKLAQAGNKINNQIHQSMLFPRLPCSSRAVEGMVLFSPFSFHLGKVILQKSCQNPRGGRGCGVKRPATQEAVSLPDLPLRERGPPAADTPGPSGKEMKTFPPSHCMA